MLISPLRTTIPTILAFAVSILAKQNTNNTPNIPQIPLRDQNPLIMPTATPKLYFGYGSNLWLHQMSLRCPHSTYLGIARLDNYRWIINDRGYANVVAVPSSTTNEDKDKESKYDNEVYGLVYLLSPSDEAQLDKNEGVPIAYTKHMLNCTFWSSERPSSLSPFSALPPSASSSRRKIDPETEVPEGVREMLVYVDLKRTTPDKPREEYVYRMNRGIEDALKVGVPAGYVKGVMREFIPAEEDEESGDVVEFARGQAAGFRDESGVMR